MPIPDQAGPFAADGGPVGVLLSHGFTGVPASVRPWGEHLAAHGCTVRVPRLPGHGTTWQEMNRTGWQDWYAEVAGALAELRRRCDRVVVGGLSMGGALALRLAEEQGRDVTAVMLVNPAIASGNKRLLAVPVVHRFLPSTAGIGNDIKKPGVEEYGYHRTPLRALHSMLQLWRVVREDLPKVTQPVLLFRSAVDHVVDPLSSRIIVQRVSSRDLTERVLENSYHVATLDHDAPRIFAESVDFVRRVTAPTPSRPALRSSGGS
ncbi:MAG: alpha/beta fold hydrolase [Actinomycetota bacterium]|nr:alpha/beta fold hydrolase [Actinomycetota bacterium]